MFGREMLFEDLVIDDMLMNKRYMKQQEDLRRGPAI